MIFCVSFGCSVIILLRGDVNVGVNFIIWSSFLWIEVVNVNLGDGVSFNFSVFGGKFLLGISGMLFGIDGVGVGYGGWGVFCLNDFSKE